MKKIINGLLAVFLAAALTGCASTKGITCSKAGKKLASGEWPSPENTTLLFFDGNIWNSMLQQNPKFGYRFYDVNSRIESVNLLIVNITTGVVGFVQPLPVGSELKVFSQTYTAGNTIYTDYFGIGGVDFVLDKPGLMYYEAGKNSKGKEKKNELSSLKLLYKYFKGTGSEWEELILNRMEELKNEK